MPKYKDSPEVRAAKKERKEKLREFLQLLDVEDYSDLRSVFKEMVGEVLENGLEAELDDELVYSKYDYRNKDTENSRNGYSRKSVKTSAGSVEIAVPRDRNGEFEPQIIKKNETSLAGDIEEKILSMYAKGMTTNDISSHIEDITATSLPTKYGSSFTLTALTLPNAGLLKVDMLFISSSPFSAHIGKVLITNCAKSAPSTPAKHPSKIDMTAIFVLCLSSSFLARISSSMSPISCSVISSSPLASDYCAIVTPCLETSTRGVKK